MAVTTIRGQQITDGDVGREDLNTTTAGRAVVRKIIAGSNITISSTGTDSGTGDVTINASGGGGVTTIGTIDSQAKSADGAVISGSSLFMQTADGSNPGLISTGTQTIAGAKTFSSNPTLSAMTAGSIIFSGTSGLLSQKNANLFWDNTNNRLGIGTNAPTSTVTVLGPIETKNNGSIFLRGLDINNHSAAIHLDTSSAMNQSSYVQTYWNSVDNALITQTVGTVHTNTKIVFRNFQNATGFVVFANGNTDLGNNPATVVNSGFKLNVNGTTRIQGAFTVTTGGAAITGNSTITGTLNVTSTFTLSDAQNFVVGSTTGTKIGTATTQKLGFFNATPIVQPANSVAINDVLVNLGLRAAGGDSTFSTTVYLPGVNIKTDKTTGTKIGTASDEKIAFFAKTPIIQPTTAIAAATRGAGLGNTITDSDTYDGYTVAQVVRALVNLGLLA